MKDSPVFSRRRFLASSAVAGAGIITGRDQRAFGFKSANDRPRVAVVGCGSRWDQRSAGIPDGPWGSGKFFPLFADIVHVCDVDADRLGRAKSLVTGWQSKPPKCSDDYRRIIDDESIDVVHVVTPDHWHAKVLIEAMLAGKDVYCEKPMTLTIEEGQQVCEVQKKTGAVVQVGTQQRSVPDMLKAIAMIRDGRLGTIKRVQCAIGSAPTSPALSAVTVPGQLNWDRWLGPASKVDYISKAGGPSESGAWSRCHYEFRWWYEYSGGKLTDWGAHHIDIATWAIGKENTGPVSIDPVLVKHPVEFSRGYPVDKNQYNTATEFKLIGKYADGTELIIRHDTDNGILFEGTEGRMFVNRGRLTGKPVEDLSSNPLADDAVEEVRRGPLKDYTGDSPSTKAHVSNFFDAVVSRKDPISDVHSHHRALTTCHLAGIAARLGRKINWDPTNEQIVGDEEAQSFVSREKRKGYEIEM